MIDIKYRTAEISWSPKSGYGNHRILVEAPQGDYVQVTLPWRRRDPSPDKVGVRICYTPSGKKAVSGIGSDEIKDILIKSSSREEGTLIFRAPEAGIYEVYYMPLEMPGPWYSPDVTYLTPDEMQADPDWISNISETNMKAGKALCYESRTDFDSFYPMEIPMTLEERNAFFAGTDPFIAVVESRLRSVRMQHDIPMIWKNLSAEERTCLTDTVCRNEHYAFQIAVCSRKELNDIKIKFTDKSGNEIDLENCICFNLDGKDADGNVMKIRRDMKPKDVLSFWCGVRAENFSGDKIEINAEISASDTDFTSRVKVLLNVEPTELPRNGDDDLWRMSRLFWLNSDIGISNDIIAPYTPVEHDINEKTVSILGRRMKIGSLGLPSQIDSFYDAAGIISEDCKPAEILQKPIELHIKENGKDAPATAKDDLSWIPEGTMQTRINSSAESDGIHIDSSITYEADGHIDCMLEITAKRDGEYAFNLDVLLKSEAVSYMMGMCHEGGKVPAQWEYVWDSKHDGNIVWLGGPRVGIQIKLMQENEYWGGADPFPKLWYNDGKGGIRVKNLVDEGTISFDAWTGSLKMHAGQTEMLHFHMIVTPFHPVYYKSHWTEHYYHSNSWHSDEPIPSLERAKEHGASIVILHQGGPLNENINYPFFLTPKLKEEVDKAHSMGMRYKIYYTVRELSNYAVELWALRSLGDEIFYTGDDFHIADYFVEHDDKVAERPEGGPWLIEHLVEGFSPAWHQYLQNGEYDCAIRTQSKSRWHNYYLCGLDWLTRVAGIDGVYLDGIGYDRHIIRRLRRIMDNIKDGCDIDIHCGNEHGSESYGYGIPTCTYLEHFAYANNIWMGEGYDYNVQGPDYYYTEICGLPLGLTSEMLEGGGNPWRGMVYGMTARAGWSQGGLSLPIWRIWDSFDIKRSKMLGYWNPECPITVESEMVKATVYLRDDGEVLLAVASWHGRDRNYLISVNKEALGIEGDYEFYAPEIEDFQEEATFSSSELIPIPAGKGWLFRLRRL